MVKAAIRHKPLALSQRSARSSLALLQVAEDCPAEDSGGSDRVTVNDPNRRAIAHGSREKSTSTHAFRSERGYWQSQPITGGVLAGLDTRRSEPGQAKCDLAGTSIAHMADFGAGSAKAVSSAEESLLGAQ
jgi:hypothetical protein